MTVEWGESLVSPTAAASAGKIWWTAAELAEARLPGLPTVKRKVNELALARQWARQTDRSGEPLARTRGGRGGGIEYHLTLLPPTAQLALSKRRLAQQAANPAPVSGGAEIRAIGSRRDQLWTLWDSQPAKAQDEARDRLAAIEEIEQLEAGGLTRSAAVAATSGARRVSPSTLWNWVSLAAGHCPTDRLPALLPLRKGGGKVAEVDEGAWQTFISDYLRPSAPTFTACYDRLAREYAPERGIILPTLKTLQRKFEREIDPILVVARRSGQDALRQTLPPQQRSVAGLSAMEVVNIDGHKWDVFVRWPDGVIARPMMVAIQDIYSRKFLAWRVGHTESAVLTRLAFSDLFKTWGIPGECVLDNGRAFASKWISGGAKTRFRFKIREDEPLGLLTQLGIKHHWALPFRNCHHRHRRPIRTRN